ncbi:MAG TPA: hypothetical protein PLQ69_06090 [Paludibacter sp.]|nr:hypothetical protein [Salinivirgaceae bacterium]HOS46030.1 hypothetical protein [Paludibacter sp.]HPM10103.1 hypothetical protein [Paludibacter sp.]
MGEDIFLFDWAEELVDKIIASICEVISKEGSDNPVFIVEREYGKLPPEKQFLLQYLVAVCWLGKREDGYEALAKQNVVDVWFALNYVP